jgi:hypothetical protein
MKKLIIIFLIALVYLSESFLPCFAVENRSKKIESFCEQEFDYCLKKIKELSKKYPILSSFEAEAQISKTDVKPEGGKYYGLDFRKNYKPSKLGDSTSVINDYLPYLYIGFSLRTVRYSGQAAIFPLEKYDELKEKFPVIQYVSNSGITIFGQIKSNDKALEEEIWKIFEEIINHILDWEKEKKTSQSTGH